MKNGQWQLGSYIFGRGTRTIVSSLEQTGYTISAGDSQQPRSDEVRFRKDYFQPGQLQFTLSIMDNYIFRELWDWPFSPPIITRADEYLEQLQKEWRSDEMRQLWGYVKPLTYQHAGQTRLVYGRPRDMAAAPRKDNPGWYNCVATFQRADTFTYAEALNGVTAKPGAPATLNRLDGSAPTWMSIFLTGPINNAVITVGPYVLTLSHNLPAGKVIQISSWPWERRAISSEGAGINIATKLVAESPYLDKLILPAFSSYPVSVAGGATTAATSCVVQWREAYHAL